MESYCKIFGCGINSSDNPPNAIAETSPVEEHSHGILLSTKDWSPLEKTSMEAVEQELQREMNPLYLQFNNTMSNWIVCITYFLILYSVAYLIMRYYRRKEEDSSENGNTLPFFLFTISFTISLSAILLLPITIISKEIMYHFPSNYYVHWINQDLLLSLWNVIFMGSNISMFIVIPFAYFYNEAEGFGKVRGLLGRIYEASTVLLLVAIIVGGLIYWSHQIISNNEQLEFLPYSFSMISTLGSLFVLASVSLGFTTLTKFGFQLRAPFMTRNKMRSKIETLDLDIQVLHRRMNENSKKWNDEEKETAKSQIRALRIEHATAVAYTNWTFFFWNFVSLSMTLINVLFPIYIILRVIVNGFLSKGLEEIYQIISLFMNIQPLQLQFQVGWIGPILETTGIAYLITSTFIGFYSLPFCNFLRPKRNETPVHKIAMNVAAILFLSSSFPITCKLLGLTSFDLLGFYNYSQYIKTSGFHLLYKAIFMITISVQYYKLILPMLVQVFEAFRNLLYKIRMFLDPSRFMKKKKVS